jgi:hypothetical protein
MLLAQAFAEYRGFVECVSAAKPQCRMGRAKRNALWSYTVSDQGQVNGLELIADRIRHQFGALKK